MPRVQTKFFDDLEYQSDTVFAFPGGIPGFEAERAFVFLKQPANHPIMFMQSLSDPEVCFILLPVPAVDRGYKLRLTEEDLMALQLPAGHEPQFGEDILCAAMICAADPERPQATANLSAPIVVNLRKRVGIQAFQPGYSHRHPLAFQNVEEEELVPC